MQLISLTDLRPHPANPRLSPREDVIEQIAAQLNGHLDEAHALIVRKIDDGYQIISGHNRFAAAQRHGLTEVPCWVREMSDDDAYMALALNNAQGELHPLEVGMHALNSGMTIRDYAKAAGIAENTIGARVKAARVFSVTHMGDATSDDFRHLAEIHAAPRWLWSALVAALIDKEWSVDSTRNAVKKVSGADEPPAWADAEKIAERLVDGTVSASDVAKFAKAVEQAKQELAAGILQADELTAELDEALEKSKPSRLSDIGEACRVVLDKQSDLIRAAKQAEVDVQRKQEEQAERQRRMRRFISLDEWKELSSDEQRAALSLTAAPGEAPSFNKQENDAIEWAQWSWNPITGCLHDCVYCYARDIANQARMEKVYPNGFAPTLHPLRLMAPQSQKLPKEAGTDTRYRNVFTGSMSDIFGRWVPAEWIEAILMQVRSAPQWNFLFLTKFPNRMAEFDIPKNAWVGTSVDLQVRVAAAEKAFAKVVAPVKWLSVEPMLEPLKFKHLDLFDWLVVGGASRSTKTPEWKPPFAWIHDLVRQARDAGTKVYFKTNLLGNPSRLLELPFDAPIPNDATELPEVFHYLGKSKDQNAAPETASTSVAEIAA